MQYVLNLYQCLYIVNSWLSNKTKKVQFSSNSTMFIIHLNNKI